MKKLLILICGVALLNGKVAADTVTYVFDHPEEKEVHSAPTPTFQNDGLTTDSEIIIDELEPPMPDSVFYNTPFLYIAMEIKPTFQGGDLSVFSQWVEKNVKHQNSQQKDAIKVRIAVKIIIDTVGKVSDVTILRSNNKELSDKVVDAIKSSPKWEPGKINGKHVNTSCIFVVNFLVDRKKS